MVRNRSLNITIMKEGTNLSIMKYPLMYIKKLHEYLSKFEGKLF